MSSSRDIHREDTRRSAGPVSMAAVTSGPLSQLVHLAPRPSLEVTPAVVAHRGASGYRPEHTLEAYRLAIAMGADDIEVDLVPTRDGVLVARHESELSLSTDVAERAELADRRTTRTVDGVTATGWFTQDLTWAEVRTLTAREPHPDLRPGNTAHDGRAGVPSFDEVLATVRAEAARLGRSVGVMAELKHPSYFASVGLPLDEPLAADLARHGLDHPRSRVTVMSFEPTALRRLAGMVRVPLVQLLDAAPRRPADLVAAGDPRTYADLAAPEGLARIDEYADGVGAHVSLVLPDPADGGTEGAVGGPTALVRDAHRRWLTVHVWTLRAENRFLPPDLRRGADPAAAGDLGGWARRLLDAGVDGLITDHPDLVLAVR